MKIATFNCNSIRARLDVILGWLTQYKPDVLCLQETKVRNSEFPERPIRDAGYQVAFSGEKSYNGVALISLKSPDRISFGLDDEPADNTRFLCATIDELNLVVAYVPQGREIDHPMYRYKIEWFKRLRKYFDRHFKTSDLLAWVGDLNVAREPIDVHNPEERKNHVCYHVDAREAFAECCRWGFVDVFRKHHPEPGQYTFFDYRNRSAVDQGLGWRLDYILASPALAAKSTDAFIDLEPRKQPKSSDHAFLAAEFKDR